MPLRRRPGNLSSNIRPEGEPDVEAIIAEADAWAEEHRVFLELVAAEFVANGEWPESKVVQRRMVRKMPGFDAWATTSSMPRLLGGRSGGSKVVLGIGGLARTEAGRAIADDASRLVSVAVTRYLDESEGDAIVTHKDVEELGLDHDHRQRVTTVILDAPGLWGGGGGPNDDGTWYRNVDDYVDRFREVSTVEDYEVVHARMQASVLRPATPAEWLASAGFAPEVAASKPVGTEVETPNAGALEHLRAVEQMAAHIRERLDAGEALSAVLGEARQLALRRGDEGEAMWLDLEALGLDAFMSIRGRRTAAAHPGIFAKYMSLHAVRDVDGEARRHMEAVLEGFPPDTPGLPAKPLVNPASVANLERSQPPPPVDTSQRTPSPEFVTHWRASRMHHDDSVRVVDAVRHEVYDYAGRVERDAINGRRVASLLGPDALAVFDALKPTLNELEQAVDELARPGRHATAATLARVALLNIGRTVDYHGPQRQVSPRDGKTYDAHRDEMSRLAAFLDDVLTEARAASDGAREAADDAAFTAMDRAYRVGSKAKNPLAISHEEAVAAVRDVYRVARFALLSGAFPIEG